MAEATWFCKKVNHQAELLSENKIRKKFLFLNAASWLTISPCSANCTFLQYVLLTTPPRDVFLSALCFTQPLIFFLPTELSLP